MSRVTKPITDPKTTDATLEINNSLRARLDNDLDLQPVDVPIVTYTPKTVVTK